ncbi:hypothetical protein SLE2022_130790 [Rubroshorea leprosula]
MYKSRLQELCQKKGWSLPEYNSTKQGQDHNPRFEAAVIVNGLSFQSKNPVKSSKEAQNDAAHVAFLHFSSPPPPTPLPPPGSSNQAINLDNNIVKSTLQVERQEANQSSQVLGTASVVKDNDDRFKDEQHLFKNLLQSFTQKRNLNQPVYSCEYEGPPHLRRFRCKVTVDGQTYEGLEFFSTMKDAEHAVAKIALTSLSPVGFQEDDSSFYKNLLQELAQKEGYRLPVYSTTRLGEAHAPTFVSTVEVEGEEFPGSKAKTKKQAEICAAKVAYTMLKERKLNRTSAILTPTPGGREVSDLSSCDSWSNLSATQQQNVIPIPPPTSNPNFTLQESADKDIDIVIDSVSLANKKVDNVSNHNLSNSFPQPDMFNWDTGSSSSEANVPLPEDVLLPEDHLSSSPASDCLSTAANFASDSSMNMPVETKSFSGSGNRVEVRPRVPNMKFPAGCTVLSISDDKWVAMKFESQPSR